MLELKLKSLDGKELGTIDLTEVMEELTAQARLSSSSDSEAQLKESRDKVAELEEQLANIQGKTMNDFTPEEKAGFVLTWARGMSLEDKAIFAGAVGIPLGKSTEAEVAEAEGAEAEAKRKAAEGEKLEEPFYIEGKTDRPGYSYKPYLNLSIKEA